jgi:hypothetical protein
LESDENVNENDKFGKNLRLSQIQPIKTAGIKSFQFGKQKGKTLHPVLLTKLINALKIFRPTYYSWKPLVMETHNPVMKAHYPLMETYYPLWKPFLKNKELAFLDFFVQNKKNAKAFGKS